MGISYLKQRIEDTLTLQEVAEHYLGKPKIGNRYHCHITPSESRDNLTVYRDHWHCYYCNQGGDMFSLVQSIYDIPFESAVTKISQDFGIADISGKLSDSEKRKLFEMDKARLVRNGQKRRAEQQERAIWQNITAKIHELNTRIDTADSQIANALSEQKFLTAERLSDESIKCTKELERLVTISDILSCKTMEGDKFYLYPETSEQAKLERKNRLLAKILCRQVTI